MRRLELFARGATVGRHFDASGVRRVVDAVGSAFSAAGTFVSRARTGRSFLPGGVRDLSWDQPCSCFRFVSTRTAVARPRSGSTSLQQGCDTACGVGVGDARLGGLPVSAQARAPRPATDLRVTGAAARHAVRITGRPDGRPMVFAHGFGCDQSMWRLVAPAFEADFRVVLFDLVGSGGSDSGSYDPHRHGSLEGYADDVVELLRELALRDAVFVGHSVSAMIGALASLRDSALFRQLVMVGPSPRYIDDVDYLGGFSAADIDDLLANMDSNFVGWSQAMAPAIMGNGERPELAAELTSSFCRTDPEIARRFAEVTFRSDTRLELARVLVPTLVLQCSEDVIAPVSVGEFVRDTVQDGTMVLLEATGHCPHLSAPQATVEAIRAFVGG